MNDEEKDEEISRLKREVQKQQEDFYGECSQVSKACADKVKALTEQIEASQKEIEKLTGMVEMEHALKLAFMERADGRAKDQLESSQKGLTVEEIHQVIVDWQVEADTKKILGISLAQAIHQAMLAKGKEKEEGK